MIRNVADILRNHVGTVEWVDVAGGIAQPIRVGDKISPAWWDGNKWIDMSPDSKKRGITLYTILADVSVKKLVNPVKKAFG